jgi:hypothetical protein
VSHPATWTCRACGSLLGRDRGGALYPVVTVEFIDLRGVARLRCPRCGRVRAWCPSDPTVAGASAYS